MQPSKKLFIGIDPTAGRQPFTYAAVDRDCRLVALAGGELEEMLAFLGNLENACVAVNAPPQVNRGLVRSRLLQQAPSTGQLRGVDLRLVEHDLRQRGIHISPTPSRPEACPAWMQMGFALYRRLAEIGFQPFRTGQAGCRWLETHPHAAYCALLGQIPLPKPTLEGRLQRQLALFEGDMGIKDPMDLFEEITRHKLLKGILPSDLIYSPEELDTLVAAFTAFLAVEMPEATIRVGDEEEGQIVLPVAALKDQYA